MAQLFSITIGRRKPRLYWGCTHVPLRYDEIGAAIEAGFEIVPALGSMGYLPMEQRYDDENWVLYPEWKTSCTLPVNIVEAIRRVNFDSDSYVACSAEEQKLFNKYIDVIYVATFPASICDIAKWYKGLIIFRSFGRISTFQSYSDKCEIEKIPLEFVASKKNFLFMPIFSSLLGLEKPWLTHNALVLRGFASRDRIPFKWLSRNSDYSVATVVKLTGWEANASGQERLKKLMAAIGSLPCRLIGKNPGIDDLVLPENIAVTGFLEHEQFYGAIASARAFVYIGDDPYHMHFTPLEAIRIGVPLFFHRNSPMGQEYLRECGDEVCDLRSLGGFDSYEEMGTVLSQVIDDLSFLENLGRKQASTLLPIFSRDSAVAGFRTIKSRIARNTFFSFCADPLIHDCRPHPTRRCPSACFPVVRGQIMRLDALSLPGPVGKVHDGRPWGVDNPVKVMLGEDIQGGFLGALYFKGCPGFYKLDMRFILDPGGGYPSAYIEVGVFDPDFVTISREEVKSSNGGEVSVSMCFDIYRDISCKTKELRFFSLANAGLVFLGGTIQLLNAL